MCFLAVGGGLGSESRVSKQTLCVKEGMRRLAVMAMRCLSRLPKLSQSSESRRRGQCTPYPVGSLPPLALP
jgi:hypothetical protein